MSRKLLALLLTGSLTLVACGSNSVAQNTGYAMAETACLLFDDSVEVDSIQDKTTEIMQKYGYNDPAEIDDYIAEIRGTEELNEVSEAARTHLEETCSEQLSTAGVTAADLAEAMVQ